MDITTVLKSIKSNYQDYELVLETAERFGITPYNLLEYVMVNCNDTLYINHLDGMFQGLMYGEQNLPSRYKTYIIAMLEGEKIFITDTQQAILLA